MLRKLFKHEIRATFAPVLIVCAVLLAFGGITRLFYAMAPLTEDFYDIFYVIAMLMNSFQMLGFSAATMFVTVLIAYRFYNTVYGNEGYCTLMLPVPRDRIIISKMFVGIMWLVLCYGSFILSYVISSAGVSSDESTVDTVVDIYATLFNEIGLALEINPTVYIIEFVILMIISIFGTVLPIFCAVSIGQLFKKHRIFGAVAAYFGMNTILQTLAIVFIYAYIIGIMIFAEGSALPMAELTKLIEMIVQAGIIVFLVLYALVIAVQYFITKHIMTNAVNLQ